MPRTKKRPSAEAKRLLQEFGQPINLERLMEANNIILMTHEMEDSVSGMLVVKEGHAIIGVNNTHHPNRQRFTIAHELGHYFLHADETKLFVDNAPVFFRDAQASEGVSPNEIEANNFAAELLMPEQFIKQQLEQHQIDAFDDLAIRRLATHLQVSVQALTIRLTKLNLL